MKKLFGILVLGLLWCNFSVAIELENFYLSCTGSKNVVGGYHTNETEYFSQDYKFETYTKSSGKKYIVSAKIVNTNNSWYGRPMFSWFLTDMPEGHKAYFDNENFETIKLTSKDSIFSSGAAILRVHKEILNLTTGTLSIHLIVDSLPSFSRNKFRFIVNVQARCTGYDKLYAYLKNTPSVPKIDDKKVVAAASGTGFFVSKAGHIVTNHHVTENCNQVKVIFKGTEVEAKIFAVDKRNDLAIIEANINPDKVYAVSNKDVSLLQDVIVAGFPLGKDISSAIKIHKGSVTALAGFGDNYSNFETDATINQGNSGGPIVDQKGNIVGVAVATWVEEGVQNIHFGIKASALKTFANANEITFLPPSNQEMSNEELGRLFTDATVFLECWMTGAKIKELIAQKNNRKAFYSKFK